MSKPAKQVKFFDENFDASNDYNRPVQPGMANMKMSYDGSTVLYNQISGGYPNVKNNSYPRHMKKNYVDTLKEVNASSRNGLDRPEGLEPTQKVIPDELEVVQDDSDSPVKLDFDIDKIENYTSDMTIGDFFKAIAEIVKVFLFIVCIGIFTILLQRKANSGISESTSSKKLLLFFILFFLIVIVLHLFVRRRV